MTAVDRRMPQYVRWHVMHVAEPDIDIKTGKKAMIVGRIQVSGVRRRVTKPML